jgi:hypothetical protein
VDKRQPLITRVSTEVEIRDAIAFADRVGVRLVIAAPGGEAVQAAALLKEKNIPVIVLQVLVLPSRQDFPHQASYAAAGELVKAGVKIAFAVPSETNARQLPYHAAEAVGWGLPREEALKALTVNAADIFGVADRIGSIEPGKIANLIVSKGDPLEIRTPITHVLIAGKTMPPDNSSSSCTSATRRGHSHATDIHRRPRRARASVRAPRRRAQRLRHPRRSHRHRRRCANRVGHGRHPPRHDRGGGSGRHGSERRRTSSTAPDSPCTRA